MTAAMTMQDLAQDLIMMEPPLLLEVDECMFLKLQIHPVRCRCHTEVPRFVQSTVFCSYIYLRAVLLAVMFQEFKTASNCLAHNFLNNQLVSQYVEPNALLPFAFSPGCICVASSCSCRGAGSYSYLHRDKVTS